MIIMLLALAAIMGPLAIWKRNRRRTRRSPLVNQLLRSPGESLRKEIEEINFDLAALIVYTPLIVVVVFASHISASYLGGQPETLLRYLLSSALGVGVLIYGFIKISGLVRRRANLQIGYEGELAVAQELSQLMRSGALVFHDVPGEGFNIDHVVVSPYGAYAIETKARTKPMRDMGKDDAKVVFDGKALTFPTWQETDPLDQAARQARWLSKWLTAAVGEQVEVRGGLALPGWFVDRTGRAEVAVFNPKSTQFLLKGWLREPMPETLIKRIAHQLDQRCRDVEPALYGKNNRIGN
ncbi:MAG: NERD domain-containing protein [Thiobacillus sp.]|nr:NERD domain-containing protein [Thiobacillus sp.]